MPADWIRNTNGEDEPSRIGTSAASISSQTLSMPRPHRADIKCSTVPTRTPSTSRQEHMRVSPTNRALALMSTGVSRSTRRNTIPVSGAAGRSVKVTLRPECRPTPLARMTDLTVRWHNIWDMIDRPSGDCFSLEGRSPRLANSSTDKNSSRRRHRIKHCYFNRLPTAGCACAGRTPAGGSDDCERLRQPAQSACLRRKAGMS